MMTLGEKLCFTPLGKSIVTPTAESVPAIPEALKSYMETALPSLVGLTNLTNFIGSGAIAGAVGETFDEYEIIDFLANMDGFWIIHPDTVFTDTGLTTPAVSTDQVRGVTDLIAGNHLTCVDAVAPVLNTDSAGYYYVDWVYPHSQDSNGVLTTTNVDYTTGDFTFLYAHSATRDTTNYYVGLDSAVYTWKAQPLLFVSFNGGRSYFPDQEIPNEELFVLSFGHNSSNSRVGGYYNNTQVFSTSDGGKFPTNPSDIRMGWAAKNVSNNHHGYCLAYKNDSWTDGTRLRITKLMMGMYNL